MSSERSGSNHLGALSRRSFVQSSLLLAASSSVLLSSTAAEAKTEFPQELVAHPPEGFVPLDRPGTVVRVTSKQEPAQLMQTNRLYPLADVARNMLEAAMCSLSGERNLVAAMRRFIHPLDRVAIKVNGIAGRAMGTNFELILPIVEAVLGVGVPVEHVTVYEQYPSFLRGTRVGDPKCQLPDGVKARFHRNTLATMKPIIVCEKIPTRYVQFLTEATAVINVSLIKDHSICGYTGALKNMTHGSIVNPDHHHRHQANPQIAQLFAHPILRSRMRLHLTDGFKLIYDGGPLDKFPGRRILHGSVHAATDPVALDAIGAELVDLERKNHRMPLLAGVGRHPKYLRSAGELGLGVWERERISVDNVTV